jgi:hypothetical protein
MKKDMKATHYLYGDVPKELLEQRKELAKQFIVYAQRAYSKIANKENKTNEDIQHALDIKKAVTFNRFLLQERKV